MFKVGTKEVRPERTFEENKIENNDLMVIEYLLKGGNE